MPVDFRYCASNRKTKVLGAGLLAQAKGEKKRKTMPKTQLFIP
jgi:hypothetical protein